MLIFSGVIGFVVALVALLKLSQLQTRVERLGRRVDQLSRQLNAAPGAEKNSHEVPFAPVQGAEPVSSSIAPEPAFSFVQGAASGSHQTPDYSERRFAQTPVRDEGFVTFERFKSQWMIWLGGLCVGLAGIFLVHYSIEQGYLDPRTRVILALLTGVALHLATEWWRRRSDHHYPSMAALAGGASMTLFAALLAALHLYQLWPPLVIFAALMVVSLVTMWLALLHGPVLAILGILGAYLVPLLVDSGSHNSNGALLYSLIISASAFLLMRWVYRPWLWWGTMAGGLFWLAIALAWNRPGTLEPVYVTVFAYLMLALRQGNYRLDQPIDRALGKVFVRGQDVSFLTETLALSLRILIVAQCVVLVFEPDWSSGIALWLPLIVVVLLASRFNRNLHFFPWFSLLMYSAAIVIAVLRQKILWDFEPYRQANQPSLFLLLLVLAITFSGFAFWQRRTTATINLNSSLGLLAPVLCLAVAYQCRPAIQGSFPLALSALLLGAVYAAFAGVEIRRENRGPTTAWLLIAAHAAYSMAAVIFFADASLTLALAVQVPLLVRFGHGFELPHIDHVVKGVIAVIVVRLTLNPWLLSYSETSHWSLWTYGGSCVAVLSGALLSPADSRLRLWLEAAALHLFVLFAGTELRYWLYDGKIFGWRFSMTEAALNTGFWAALALVCLRRGSVATITRDMYTWAARGLMTLAVMTFALLLTGYNPLLTQQQISSRPLFNILLLAYGLPVLFWALAARCFFPRSRRFFLALAIFGLWFFVTIQIRHLWQEGDLYLRLPIAAGELYSYSLAWLLMGVFLCLAGALRQQLNSYRAGLLLLGIVVAKIFLIDMNGLQGILRVFSFMGLGLCLLGLAFVHQAIDRRRRTGAAPVAPVSGDVSAE